MTWWKVFPRRLLNTWPSVHSSVVFQQGKPSLYHNIFHPHNIINYFLIYLSFNHKKRVWVYIMKWKRMQPCRRWAILTGSPGIFLGLDLGFCPYACDTPPLLHSGSSREHKARCMHFSWEAVYSPQTFYRKETEVWKWTQAWRQASSRPSASILQNARKWI